MPIAERADVFVSEKSANENISRFEHLVGLEHEKKEVIQDPLYDEWKDVIPQSEYGNVSLPSAFGSFITGYKQALTEGKIDNFVEGQLQTVGYQGIYRAIAHPELAKTNADNRVREQHAPLFLAQIDQRLDEFAEKIHGADVPEVYKDEYTANVNAERQHLKIARTLTTPDYTNAQKSQRQWGKFIDVEKSQQEGTIVLPHEDAAIQVLERSKNIPKIDVKVKDALKLWELSPAEAKAIGVDLIDDNAKKLTPDQGARLMAVVLNRLDRAEWKVEIDENTSAVTVNAKQKKVKFPGAREFVGMDVVNIPSHENMHVVRGENGSMQGLGLLREGVDEYLATEEGVGAVAEMIMGEPFGDPRQVKFAARYLAAAMALKSDVDENGSYVPRHSTQEIYETLRSYGVDEIDSSDIVWRLTRGTSLQHKTTFIDVATDEGTFTLPAAECYAKDTVYFEGQMEVFKWIKDHMPLDPNVRMRKAVTLDSDDFSVKLLARVGLSREQIDMDVNHTEPIRGLKQRYNSLVKLGRQTLIDILNIHGAGKMRLDFLDDDSQWFQHLRFGTINGLTDYGKILISKDEIDVEKFITKTE